MELIYRKKEPIFGDAMLMELIMGCFVGFGIDSLFVWTYFKLFSMVESIMEVEESVLY